jgi:hypothetical protein
MYSKFVNKISQFLKEHLHIIISPHILLFIFATLILIILALGYLLLTWPSSHEAPKPYELLSLVVAFFTFIVYTATLVVISNQIGLDHERRRKQATIEHIEKIRSNYRTNNAWIKKEHGDQITVAKLTPEQRTNILDMLSQLEHLSAGVLTGVFDLALLDRMSGAFLRRLFHRVEPLITEVRKERNQSNAFVDYADLVDKIYEIRKEGKYAPKAATSKQGVMGGP